MSNLTDPDWIAQFTDHCAPARRRRQPCWRRDLAEFNEALRSRFGLLAAERRIFGWQVRQAVAAHFGLTRAEIAGASRLARCVWPRQVAMYLCVRAAGLSCRQTGALFGGRDQSTVRHAVGRVAARIAGDQALDETVGALAAACREVTEER
ncbi:MAG TPA: helix-turn-helix domain-containing protein [Xanthobacteraceae bacterium]|nr:helix-turn-helix domain-containing protein [Xanthobacteraceae bacterium]